MDCTAIRILKAHEVAELLEGQETAVLRAVQLAYEAHALGASSLPHSTFLRFPNQPQDRIIALPAYLGQNFEVAGVKWIASFPGNHTLAMERASAVVIVNSVETGRPEAILEGSIISASRTAASAALAARYLHPDRNVTRVGLIGCGLINREIVRFLRVVFPLIHTVVVFDKSAHQARQFRETCRAQYEDVEVIVAHDTATVLGSAPLCSLATTATEPHIHDLAACAPGSTILHVSLRDLSPRAILACDNIVDDVDHVCRANTSLHLAEQLVGHRDFIRATLAAVTSGAVPSRVNPSAITVFSPFGLGVLDLAVSKLVLDRAIEMNCGDIITSFLPGTSTSSMHERTA